jgi:hypothetical protein
MALTASRMDVASSIVCQMTPLSAFLWRSAKCPAQPRVSVMTSGTLVLESMNVWMRFPGPAKVASAAFP